MECDGNNLGSNQGLLQIGLDKEIGLGFDVNSAVSKTRVEKMDVEKLGKKKRSAEMKIGFDSDDDEPIGSMFKIKSRRNTKKVKVENDGGLDLKKLEIDDSQDQELGGMDDTLATFRKKMKGPKKGPRVSAPKLGDFDTNLKNTNLPAESKTVTKEPFASEDGIVESIKKGSKNCGKDKSKKSGNKKVSGENLTENDKEGGLEKNKRSKSKSVKKKISGENLTQNDLEDSLSAFLIKAQSGALQKSKKMSKLKKVKTTQACNDGEDQKPSDPVTVEIKQNEMLTVQPSKDPIGNDVFKDDLNNSSSEIAKLTHDVSEIEVHEEKMDPTCPIPESVPNVGFITSPTSPTDQKIFPSLLVHNETMDQGSNPNLNPVGGVVLDQVQNGSRDTQPHSQKEVNSSDSDSPNHEIVSISSQKENASTSDENEAYASESGSMLDPETKSNKKAAGKRIVRQAKRHRHDDMAYEGDADWDTLIHEQSFLVNHQDGEKVQSVKTKGKLDFLQTIAVEAESGGVAAVSVGLKARSAGPVEKMKFKELLKRKGGLQEYIECRNHILHLWNKDVTRILPLSECGISDTAVADEHPQASLIRDIYSFLDQYSYINFGVASKKETSDGGIKPNFRLSGEENDSRNSGAPVTDLDDGVSFILGKNKNYDHLTDEFDTATECPEGIIKKDKDTDVSDSPFECLEKNCLSGKLPDSPCKVEDPVDQKEPTVCMQCDDSETRKKIIIIGAGPAGLTAARHLTRLGFHVAVLEARDRIGGRVFTDRSSLSVPVDLGASIITGVEADVTSQRRPDPSSLICAQLGLELTVLNSDCPLYDTVTGQKVPPDLDEALEAEYNSLLDDMQLVVAQKGDHAREMSLEEGLQYGLKIRRVGSDKTGTEDEIFSPLERRVMDWHLAHLEYGCAASLQQVSLPYWNQDDIYGGFGGAHCMIKGGYGAIVDSLKDGIHIHLNHMVTDIYYQQENESANMERNLYEVSLTGDVQALNALLHQDQLILDRLTLTGFNETPLHIAAIRGHLHFGIEVLSRHPKLVTALDSKRRTPLHLASANGNLEMVQELVRVGGRDVCCFVDQDGLTPLHLAVMNGQLEVVKALVQVNRGAAKEIQVNGETILHICVSYHCFEALKVLIELWNEEELAKITDHGGNTLLHAAAINKQTQILNYLLGIPSIKANGNVVNRLGLTALDVLDQCPRDLKSIETREILMKAGVLRANDLRPLPTLHSSTKSSETKRKGLLLSRTWARYVNDDHHWIEKQRGILIVAALIVAGMSFHSGINPPGGTISNTQNGQYELGNAVQTEVDMDNFNRFVAYNSFTMIISLAIVLVLISGFPLRNKFWLWVLTLGTLFTMVSMVATYLQSLAMMSPDMYLNVTSVWICLIWMLGCGVIALIHTIFFVTWVVMKLSKCRIPEIGRKGNQDAGEV